MNPAFSGDCVTDSSLTLNPVLSQLELTPQDRNLRPSWGTIVSGALSFALVVAIAFQVRTLNLATITKLLPDSLLFWGVFLAYFLVGPVSEWVIFRRLWAIPSSGVIPLLRKKVYNELVLGYLGEAYFYSWARKRVGMTSAPFGAVKDVAILSAMAGNASTLALLILMWPFVGVTQLGLDTHLVVWSLGVILVVSLAMTLLRRQVFSLPLSDLWFIMQVHLVRICASIAFLAMMWHLALPAVALQWWLFLATLRMLVSRLPLVPNKDLVFAGVAVFTLGREGDIGSLMALVAGLVLVAHLIVGAFVLLADLVRPDIDLAPEGAGSTR
jgi:hypothetical protein